MWTGKLECYNLQCRLVYNQHLFTIIAAILPSIEMLRWRQTKVMGRNLPDGWNSCYTTKKKTMPSIVIRVCPCSMQYGHACGLRQAVHTHVHQTFFRVGITKVKTGVLVS